MTKRSFHRLTISTLLAVYILILVGGIVRSTGSGMGCPDWPKCFGQWVPPSRVSELPENYKEIYSQHRQEKNERFARYLSAIGFKGTAQKIETDESIKEEADFNPVKTWIEYVNRLLGVIIGLFIIAVTVASFSFWTSNRSITLLSAGSLILVVFQGWIGSIVVSTNLTPWTITFHMFLALLLVALLLMIVVKTVEQKNVSPIPGSMPWMIACMVLLLIQVALGTQVREELDRVALQVSVREGWIASLGLPFLIHRSFSWLVLLAHAGLFYKLLKYRGINGFNLVLFLLILGTLITGVGMAYLTVPPFLQPLHLWTATLAFGFLFFMLLQLNTTPKQVLN